MEIDQALDIGREGFLMAITIASPILFIGLLVGLCIALFQAVTQLHEQTLTFIPKILAMIGATAIFLPWIVTRMLDYAAHMFGEPLW